MITKKLVDYVETLYNDIKPLLPDDETGTDLTIRFESLIEFLEETRLANQSRIYKLTKKRLSK
jgi:hypothetical protein